MKPAQIQGTSSFISLGLVYPLPQPLISNRPRQCRSSAKGRHPVPKRYSGEGTHPYKSSVIREFSPLDWSCDIIQYEHKQYSIQPGSDRSSSTLPEGTYKIVHAVRVEPNVNNSSLTLHLVTDSKQPFKSTKETRSDKENRRSEQKQRQQQTQQERSKARATLRLQPACTLEQQGLLFS